LNIGLANDTHDQPTMTKSKSKSGGLAGIPKEQKCSFLIGPVSSWFMPNSVDLWTQPKSNNQDIMSTDSIQHADEKTVCDSSDSVQISYFAYGSIGCFCLGEIHHRNVNKTANYYNQEASNQAHSNQVSAIVNRLADVKNDNSRVACVRFQKSLPYPILLVLTESGSLLIHDCLLRENLLSFKKSELLRRFVGLTDEDHQNGAGDHRNAKRAKFNVAQQLNSCTWPDPNNIFLGVSLNQKTCMLVRLKLNDIIGFRSKVQHDGSNKGDVVVGHQKIDLDLKNFTSPICLIESAMLDKETCLIAVAMDDGLITVIRMNLKDDRILRTIKLARHTNQICSMSLFVGDRDLCPMGLLSSISRDGLALVWDLQNEFYFADYLAIQNADRGSSAKINWFALRFIGVKNVKSIYLVVSNVDSGLTLLKLPKNMGTKIRLKELNREVKNKSKHNLSDQVTLKHNALIFNVEYDPVTQILISSSLDGNQILWSLNISSSNDQQIEEVKQQFLVPALLDNARTHMLRHSPIREELLCLALGKAGVRFYSISDNIFNSRYDMNPSCSLVARKVAKAGSSPTSIAWHPHHEYRLAIGTLEGKVFRADITPRKAALVEAELVPSGSRKIQTSQKSDSHATNHLLDDALGVDYKPMERDTSGVDGVKDVQGNNPGRTKTDGIYSLCWGPNPTCPEDITKHAIYAIGSITHKLFIYCSSKDNSEKLTNYLDEFNDTSLPEASDLASEVAWKSSMDMMALGTTDGRIIIVTYLDESHQERSNHKLFKHLVTIQGPFGQSYIQCLAWHPAADKEDSNYYKIAASSNDSPAFVFNLRETLLVADVRARLKLEQSNGGCYATATEAATTTLNQLASYSNVLKAHEKAITDIAWNPHEPNQLATCSFDRTCYVWSIDTSLLDARVIAKFSARDRLFTLDWSLVDSDLILTSGHDSVVWAWRPTENPHHLVSV
jgi:WD40 repeat protein